MSEQKCHTWKTAALILLPALYLSTFGLAFCIMERPPLRKPTAGFWIIVALVTVPYCIAYSADVTIGDMVVVAADYDPGPNEPLDMKYIWRSVDFRFGGRVAEILFLPIHLVDRKLRPDVWGHYEP